MIYIEAANTFSKLFSKLVSNSAIGRRVWSIMAPPPPRTLKDPLEVTRINNQETSTTIENRCMWLYLFNLSYIFKSGARPWRKTLNMTVLTERSDRPVRLKSIDISKHSGKNDMRKQDSQLIQNFLQAHCLTLILVYHCIYWVLKRNMDNI